MYDTGNRYSRIDLNQMLQDAGVALTIAPLLQKNHTEDFIREAIETEHGVTLETGKLQKLIADLTLKGDLEGAADSGQEATARAAAPSGIGCAGGNVWVTPPGDGATLWFYVNAVYKKAQTITDLGGGNWDGHLAALSELGATSGDIVQCCQVVDGVPGWWARIPVP